MKRLLVGTILLGYCLSAAQALSSDRTQVLHARSDTAEINQQTGVSTYLQHVFAVQGTTSLTADKVVTRQDAHHQLIEVIAYGQPAVYKTIPEQGKAELTATALEIHYFPDRHYVELIHQAVVVQNGNRYEAPRINYDIDQQVVVSPVSSAGHTSIVLQPATFKQ